LLKRKQEPWKDHWNFPAGFVEIEETPEQAVVREVKEESGFDVSVSGFDTMIYYRDDPRGHGIILFYRCKKYGGVFSANQEASAFQFFGEDELPPLIASSGHQRMIKELIRRGFKDD